MYEFNVKSLVLTYVCTLTKAKVSGTYYIYKNVIAINNRFGN